MGFFVGIGAQRTGTTWLATYLEAHPQVFMAAGKELHYFDAVYGPELCREFHRLKREQLARHLKLPNQQHPRWAAIRESLESRVRMEHDESEYVAYFERRVGEAKIFGEITPSYSMLDENGFRAMLRLYPEARFLFLLRNPADRFWSQLRHHMQSYRESFSGELFQRMLEHDDFLLRADYRRTFEELDRAVPPARVLVLFSEQLFGSHGEAQLRRITDFLDIDYLAPDLGRVVNRGLKQDLPQELRAQVVQKFLPVYEYARQRFGDIPDNWLADLEALGPAAPFPPCNVNASDTI